MQAINSMALKRLSYLLIIAITVFIVYGCNSSSGNQAGFEQPTPQLPVITVSSTAATTYKEYAASLQGSKDIEIRPQVNGYLDKIYVDEGDYVRKGQPLFQINDRPYAEQLNNAKATLAAAKANQTNAQINVAKITPLVQNNVVSDVQLKTAQAAYDAATANVAQAEAMVQNAADCVFTDCNLSNVMPGKTVFMDIYFKDCKMLGLHFEHCSEFGLSFRFENCVLNHSSFYSIKIK